MSDLSAAVAVRFPPSLADAARALADLDGMSLSAWLRREVDREIGRRTGVCAACGQPVPAQDVPATRPGGMEGNEMADETEATEAEETEEQDAEAQDGAEDEQDDAES